MSRGRRQALLRAIVALAALAASLGPAGCAPASPPAEHGPPSVPTPVAPAVPTGDSLAEEARTPARGSGPGNRPDDGGNVPPGPLPPNELGQIMVLEYHVIGPEEGRWARTPDNFRRDLEALYERGYRPVNMIDVIEGRIDLPRGYSPVVLTFDDGTIGQFRYLERDGRRAVDPDSAVGILLAFHERHHDWPLKASFYVNDIPFGQADSWRDKIRFLVENGFEVGNHTLTHANLGRLDAAATERELGGLDALLAQADPSLSPATLALPYGALPRAVEAAKAGTYQGRRYRIKGFLLVGANPAPSPFSRRFDPYRVPRIQAVDPRFEERANLAYWLGYFDDHPERRYVSDGDPDTVTAPRDLLVEARPDVAGLTPR